jgi:hypothetical protein
MYTGDWFTLNAGQSYPIDILIGERPGGQFNAYLLIQQKDADYPVITKGISPALPVFQTKALDVPKGSKGTAPAVTPNPFVTK